MRIQLLNPSVRWYSRFEYRTLPALALPILAAVLNKAGHQAEVADLEALGVTPDRLRDTFASQRDRWPDVVGLTAITMTQRGVEASIRALRQAGYDRRIVVGGVAATIDWTWARKAGADGVVLGECEGNVVEIFEDAASLPAGERKLWVGKPMPIEDIPAPDWDHHSPRITDYHANLAMLRPFPSTSQWTRGCPYRCTFCGNVIFGGQPTRYRPAANVIAEMVDLARRGARHCFVYDDELVGGPGMPKGWMTEIADGLEPLGIRWITLARCSRKHVTVELLREMKRAGCFYIFWGVESFSPEVLRLMRKGLLPSDIWHTLRAAREAGIRNAVLTMVGNYGETEEDLEATADALGIAYREGLVQYRQTTVCTPMPGTELYRKAVEEGWYVEPPDQGEQMLTVHAGTPWVSAERLRWWLGEFDRVCPAGEWGQT